MFFMMGITQGRRNFDYDQVAICDYCGSYGRYQVFMTYICLSLFFIPCLKWDKQYYVQSTCCNTIYSLGDREADRKGRKCRNTAAESDAGAGRIQEQIKKMQ